MSNTLSVSPNRITEAPALVSPTDPERKLRLDSGTEAWVRLDKRLVQLYLDWSQVTGRPVQYLIERILHDAAAHFTEGQLAGQRRILHAVPKTSRLNAPGEAAAESRSI